MELLFIILSLGCQILILSHASDINLGSQVLMTALGISFTGRGLMILSVIFLALAAFFGVIRISDNLARKKEIEEVKTENAQLKADKVKKETAKTSELNSQRN